MNFKKTKVAVASGLMAASMVLAPLAAYANQNTDGSFDSVSIQKTVNVADGVTIAGNIHFSVTQVPNQGANATVAPNENAETKEIKTITGLKTDYKVETDGKTNASDETDRNHSTGDFTYVTSVSLDFSRLTTPGEYTFVVKELKTGDDGNALAEKAEDKTYGWTFDDTQYLVRVYVKNDANHTKEYTVQKGTYNDSTKTWTKGSAEETKKDTAAFSNTYEKRGNGNDEEGASLVISKVVEDNEYADPDEDFKFTIKFEADKNSPAQVPSDITATMPSGNNSWKKTENENEYEFTLKKDEQISFADLPAGIHYTVTESNFTNKKSTTNIATSNNIGVKSSEGETTGKQLIGENTNSAEFTNTFKGVTITGVVTHSAPFVIMVGALFVAVGGYVVLKKRIEE